MYINKLFLILFFSFLQHYCGAQKKAVTELGDEVILYDNGTWKYSKEFDVNDSSEIKISPIVYTKSKNASFLLKSSHGNLGYWVDPKKWTFGKSSSNPNSDFELEFKGQSLFSVIISEEAAIPVESYIKIAVQNGRESCPDIHITHKEYRIVNGIKVLNLQMEGTLAGVKFAYFGYYFSNENTAVQFIVTSYAATFKKYQSEAEELLNGLTVLPTTTDDTQKKASLQDIKSDSLKQGLYSPNNKCKQFFEGQWSYLMNGKVVTVKRTFKKTIEYMEHSKYLYEYDNKWINDCSYEIIFKRTTEPNFKLINVGESILVNILEIDNKSMRWTGLFRGVNTTGEMTKQN